MPQLFSPTRNEPVLTGLRGAASLLIVLFHFFPRQLTLLNYGWAGVDLFFILSGFLIGSILLSSPLPAGKLLKNYFLKRVLRIIPLYFIVVLGTYLLIPLVFNSHEEILAPIEGKLWRHLLFVQNLILPRIKHNLLGPTWSISVEVHFYFLFPLFALLLKSRTRIITLLILILGIWIVRWIWYYQEWTSFEFLYSHTFARGDCLLAGLLLASLTQLPGPTQLLKKVSPWAFLAGAAGGLVCILLPASQQDFDLQRMFLFHLNLVTFLSPDCTFTVNPERHPGGKTTFLSSDDQYWELLI